MQDFKNMQKQQGFTLIELMIVVAIIGILAAIAIPMYQDYVAKTQVAGAYSELSNMKTPVNSMLMEGAYPNDNMSTGTFADEMGWTDSTFFDANKVIVDFSASDGSGTITGVMGDTSSSAVSGTNIILTRDTDGSWSCNIDGGSANNYKDKYSPAGCTTS